MLTYSHVLISMFDYFSDAIHNVIQSIENLGYITRHMKVIRRPYCANGKHMRRKNYRKAMKMDKQIASQHKHFL